MMHSDKPNVPGSCNLQCFQLNIGQRSHQITHWKTWFLLFASVHNAYLMPGVTVCLMQSSFILNVTFKGKKILSGFWGGHLTAISKGGRIDCIYVVSCAPLSSVFTHAQTHNAVWFISRFLEFWQHTYQAGITCDSKRLFALRQYSSSKCAATQQAHGCYTANPLTASTKHAGWNWFCQHNSR